MSKRIGIIAGASGVGSSTLIQAILKMESKLLATYDMIKFAYPIQGREVPTLEEFREDIRDRSRTRGESFDSIINGYRMGCLRIETPKYEDAKGIKEARQKFVDFFETNKRG